jgi:hypothetical protein
MNFQGKADITLKHLFLLTDVHDREYSYTDVDVTVFDKGNGRHHISLPDLPNVFETTHIKLLIDGEPHFFGNIGVNAREDGFLLSGQPVEGFPKD